MKEPLDRSEIIRLLQNLGSDQDNDILSAARDLNQKIATSGLDWDELLIPEEEQSSTVSDHNEPKNIIDDDVKGKINDSLTLIEKLLSDPARSDAMRQELEEYKNDISNGDFSDSDHKYVRALFDRLSK